MKVIYNIKIQKFLAEHNIYPESIICGIAYYEATAAITSLLEKYYIRYVCMPNKL